MTPNTPAVGNPFVDNNKATNVNNYHNDDDVNNGTEAHHHTLGHQPGMAANGFEVKMALDQNEENLEAINQLIVDLTAVTNDLIAQTAILDKVGKRWERLATLTTNFPNAAAAPYTAMAGFDVHEGDTFAEVGVEYTGAGVFTCLETGSYNFEVGVNWAANATGRRLIFVNLNSSASGANSYYRFTFVPVTADVCLQFHKFDMKLAVNDVIRFAVYQNSGGILANSLGDGIERSSVSYAQMVGVTRILGQ